MCVISDHTKKSLCINYRKLLTNRGTAGVNSLQNIIIYNYIYICQQLKSLAFNLLVGK